MRKYGSYKVRLRGRVNEAFNTALEAHACAVDISFRSQSIVQVLKLGPRSGKYATVARYKCGKEMP